MKAFRRFATPPRRWRARDVVVPALVIGSLVVAVAVSVAIGAERPYPGVALGSGLLLELERAIAVWVTVLVGLVVGGQALRGRLPVEISGRGVRYAAEKEVVEIADNADDLVDRVHALEVAVGALRAQPGRSEDRPVM